MKPFRFHLLGLVHLPSARQYTSCAFTQKNVKLSKMLCSLGHEVFLYGCRSAEEPPIEGYVQSDQFHFIETHHVNDIARTWGDGNNLFEIGYDWTGGDFRHDFSKQPAPLTVRFCGNCIAAIERNKQPDDFLLCTQGSYHTPIAKAVKLFLTCEPGVGYRGSVPGRYRAFESAYIQNFSYGSAHPYECINGNYYDRVIPNYFDPDDITFSAEKDDYYLFIGRMIRRKGILTAAKACEAIGARLIIAGQGAHVTPRGTLLPNEQPDFELHPGTWEYVGYAGVEQRKQLMARARATFTPTEYMECFAGTHVESMLSGTPVITTNFAVFPGTFPEGIAGFHCDTLDDFVWAARQAPKLDPGIVRAWAERYLMDHVKWQYQKWFEDLYQLRLSATQPQTNGWHHVRKEQAEWREDLARADALFVERLRSHR